MEGLRFRRILPVLLFPFWDDSGWNVRYLRIFQVDYTFYKLDAKILAPNNEISSRKNSGKFNFKVIIWESKRSWRAHFQAFRDLKIQSFGNHNAISGVYWVYYKPLVLIYWENGTYARELHVRASGLQNCS